MGHAIVTGEFTQPVNKNLPTPIQSAGKQALELAANAATEAQAWGPPVSAKFFPLSREAIANASQIDRNAHGEETRCNDLEAREPGRVML